MKGTRKYSISEFSKKTGVSIRTLHYYDDIGLLKPDKHPTSGHRIYDHQDILTLQKILCLKFLGYSLDNIADLLGEASFTSDLNRTLALHLQGLENEKERIEQSMAAVKRVMMLLEKEGEVDSAILLSLIHSMQTEAKQREWMEHYLSEDVVEGLLNKSEQEKVNLDQTFIQLSKELKKLYGKPIEDAGVQAMIKTYLEATFSFLGEDLMKHLADVDVEEMEIQEFEDMTPSPFTEDEQQWLNQAVEYYMKQAEMK
ncbi:MerR family transcriptional regulator [Metabacillus malikii]|uniref:DNA-binding transcriptional MerR regulator n=1 Tax=Metabacillus malikii TaxID=1504265 RepID=A0ABT9Z9Y4_9BACI|nr:MerR family transcriptional regulator [Metabacillus malikii]MDQ0229047.1 DNA-binding transcriptional MerR regulator [Metabacillus malikii]